MIGDEPLAGLSQFGGFEAGKSFIFRRGFGEVWPTNEACQQGRFRA